MSGARDPAAAAACTASTRSRWPRSRSCLASMSHATTAVRPFHSALAG